MDHVKQLEGLEQIEVGNFALFDHKISDHIYRIREPVEVSSVQTRIVEKRENIKTMTLAINSGENVGNVIQQNKEDIFQLRNEEEQRLLQGGTVKWRDLVSLN